MKRVQPFLASFDRLSRGAYARPILRWSVLLLPAGLLRFWHLGTWSLWEDEVLTVLDARAFPQVLRINPLPYLLTKGTLALFGTNAWGARMGFALVGVASVVVVYALAQALYDRATAFWAALLTGVHPWHLFWSQNARAYVLTFLFSGIAVGSLYLGLERDQRRWFFLCLFALFALVASHLLSAALLVALAAYVLGLRLRPAWVPRGWRWSHLLIPFGPFLLLALLSLYPSLFRRLTSGWGLNLWARSPFYVLATFGWGVSVPVAALSLAPLYEGVRHFRRDHFLLACFALVPPALFVVEALLLNVAGYYLFFCVPAYLVLAGWTLARLLRWNARLTWPVPLLVLGVLLAQDVLYHTREFGGRPRWREAFQYVQRQADVRDGLVIPIPRMADYYWPAQRGPRFQPKQLLNDPEAWRTSEQVQGRRVWFLLDEPTLRVIDPAGRFRAWLSEHARWVQRYGAYARAMDRSVSVYRLDPR